MIHSNLPPPESDPKNLIVNYIPTPVTDEELRKIFAPFGTVESARVILDRITQHPKGYGFVKYTTEEAAKKAITYMNGYEIGNKRLRVTQANGPQNRSIQQYTERLVYMQPPPPLPPVHAAQYVPQAYTVVGPGAPIYGQSAALPTLMLAPQPTSATGAVPPPTYGYAPNTFTAGNPNGTTTASTTSPASQFSSVIIEMDGKPVQLVANGPLPNIFQQHTSSPSNQGGPLPTGGLSPSQQPQIVRPLCFTPFQPGSPQGDPLMHSSFQLSVGGASSAMTSITSFDPSSMHTNSTFVPTTMMSVNGSKNTLQ